MMVNGEKMNHHGGELPDVIMKASPKQFLSIAIIYCCCSHIPKKIFYWQEKLILMPIMLKSIKIS
jgi:hypothetical protein